MYTWSNAAKVDIGKSLTDPATTATAPEMPGAARAEWMQERASELFPVEYEQLGALALQKQSLPVTRQSGFSRTLLEGGRFPERPAVNISETTAKYDEDLVTGDVYTSRRRTVNESHIVR